MEVTGLSAYVLHEVVRASRDGVNWYDALWCEQVQSSHEVVAFRRADGEWGKREVVDSDRVCRITGEVWGP